MTPDDESRYTFVKNLTGLTDEQMVEKLDEVNDFEARARDLAGKWQKVLKLRDENRNAEAALMIAAISAEVCAMDISTARKTVAILAKLFADALNQAGGNRQ
jgi:hypothetical protein